MAAAILIAAAAMILAVGGVVYWPSPAEAQHQATLYKNPQCSCCEEYAAYLRRNGYHVKVVATHDLELIKQEHGVPGPLEGCHTMLVEGYVVEGHVPVDAVNRLLDEKPSATKGISLPGMPAGSPGMGGTKASPFTIFAIDTEQPSESPRVFATE
jgi:hypothetical protein